LSEKRKKGEGKRRLSRKLALTLLFQHDSVENDPKETIRLFKECFQPSSDEEESLGIDQEAFEASWPMAEALFLGVTEKRPELDADIEGVLQNWKLARVSKVDRALIRLAYYEMCHCPDIPYKISLNEAIEIAKDFGETDSQKFVNGVLDKLKELRVQKNLE
jgi:N utilization substance protein B